MEGQLFAKVGGGGGAGGAVLGRVVAGAWVCPGRVVGGAGWGAVRERRGSERGISARKAKEGAVPAPPLLTVVGPAPPTRVVTGALAVSGKSGRGVRSPPGRGVSCDRLR